MFKKNQMLKIKKHICFLNDKNYYIHSNGDIENKKTNTLFNTIMQSYTTIKCPITTNCNYFTFNGWYWYDWMFENIQQNYLLDIE